MIEASHLSKSYQGQRVVRDLSFEVPAGQTLVLLGTSGCGKTTTLKMLNRLVEPDQGTIRINHQDVRDQSPQQLRLQMGYVIQQVGLFPHYSVFENIAVVPRLLRWPSHRISQRVYALIEQLKLSRDLVERLPHELSGGQQQRVGLARALAADPPVVLMDEPFGALDAVTRSSIVQDFRSLEELANKTIVMVTHDILEAIFLGDQIAVMNEGSILEMGTPGHLAFNPLDPFVKEFLGQHQLQLQLLSVSLKDLGPWINSEGPFQAFDHNISLWKILNQDVRGQVIISEEHRQALWAGFEQFKKHTFS